jgi:hypothetical protein
MAILLQSYILLYQKNLKTWSIPLICLITAFYIIEHKNQTPKYISKSDFAVSQTDKLLLTNKTVLNIPWGVRDGLKSMGKFNVFDYNLMMQADVNLVSAYISRIQPGIWKKLESDEFFILLSKTQISPTTEWTNKEKWIVMDGLSRHKINALRIPDPYGSMADRFKSIKQINWIESKTSNCVYLTLGKWPFKNKTSL